MARSYEIVKFYERRGKMPRVLQCNYSLEQARKYCSDSETSSYAAMPPKGCGGNETKIAKWHKSEKHWFIGFRLQA